MTVQSIGDQARAFAMQAASSRIKTTMATLTAELSSGEVADLGSRLQGNTQALAGIESRLSMLAQFGRNAAEAAAHTRGMQDALSSVQSMTGDLGKGLYLEPLGVTDGLIAARSAEAASTLQAVIGQLNGTVGQRFLFSGTQSDTQPLASADTILTALTAQVAGLATAQDVAQAVSAWFDAPPGMGGFADVAYHGGSGGQLTPIAEDATIALTTTALSPALRDSLKGLAMAALVDHGALAGDGAERRKLLQAAGKALLDNSPPLIAEMSRIGYAQQVIATAQTEGTAATATLQIARNTLREADPFATSAALSESETKLQTLYSVIGRLSQLKLADYL
ncbi:flagellar hook protein [Paracoccus everestensis]|uniref:flagellar hook protein n=1 Tax=Paracoccus everestensis TaxID=2903900 RepID=UPI001F2607D8|nr:flagellar hook protein [Paracoccus everestensis]